MKPASRRCFCLPLLTTLLFLIPSVAQTAEPVPLKRVVELALSQSPLAVEADEAQQRAFASYHEVRDQYLPQLAVGSGLGATVGYPLSLEGSAPSIVNTTAQSTVINPALRDFIREARTQYRVTIVQSKDQRDQVVQDAVLSYAELSKWESLASYLTGEYTRALKMEQMVNERIREGVDSPLARNQARLNTARVYLHVSQAQGAIDVLRSHLSHVTGLPASSIQTIPDSIPALPEVKQEDDLRTKALQQSPAIELANLRSTALAFRARGEHRAMLPTVDFAAQYALLASFNNYQQFFQPHSFQPNNATIGVVIRFPFFSPTQRAHAQAADAESVRAKKDIEVTHNQVSEQTLKLQRAVAQLNAAQEVADLEYQVAKSDLEAIEIRQQSGTATLHEEDNARAQAAERYTSLQDANFELERARINLLRATGDLGAWVGVK